MCLIHPPLLNEGFIRVHYKRDDEEKKQFASRVLPLVKKISTENLVSGQPFMQKEQLESEARRGVTSSKTGRWVGYDAMRWMLEKPPRRMVGGGSVSRPGWIPPPLSQWYEGTENIPRGDIPAPDVPVMAEIQYLRGWDGTMPE